MFLWECEHCIVGPCYILLPDNEDEPLECPIDASESPLWLQRGGGYELKKTEKVSK